MGKKDMMGVKKEAIREGKNAPLWPVQDENRVRRGGIEVGFNGTIRG